MRLLQIEVCALGNTSSALRAPSPQGEGLVNDRDNLNGYRKKYRAVSSYDGMAQFYLRKN